MSYIIRVYAQDLGNMKPIEMEKDLIDNGLEIIKGAGSSFGACWFIEVTGKYKGNLIIDKTDIDAKNFKWQV